MPNSNFSYIFSPVILRGNVSSQSETGLCPVLGYIDLIVVYYFKLGHYCSKQSPKYRSTIKLLSFVFMLFTCNSLPAISQLQPTVSKSDEICSVLHPIKKVISWLSSLFSTMKCNILYTRWKEILLFIRNKAYDRIFIEKHSACYMDSFIKGSFKPKGLLFKNDRFTCICTDSQRH